MKVRNILTALLATSALSCTAPPEVRPATTATLEGQLAEIAKRSDGRLGVCAIDDRGGEACVNGDVRFSLQSVMKLIVAAAAMDALDRKGGSLDDVVVVRREDLSLNVQPLATMVPKNGEFRTTVRDLIERAVTDSDSAAADILYDRVGGEPALREFLIRNEAYDQVRVDRDERHLQTETGGLAWRSEFVDPAKLAQARAAVTRGERAAAFAAYLRDPRDTATPRAMARFLMRLARGDVLSPASTRQLLEVMARTRTGPGRLRAGPPAGWSVAHKTGTSGDLDGLNGTTNDVGLLRAPDGTVIAVAAFLSESRHPPAARDAVIAASARAVAATYAPALTRR